MNQGYIKLYRKFKDWYGYRSNSRKALWIELLLQATHKEISIVFNGKPITLLPGQLVAGRKKLAEDCKMSESWIEKLLSEFEKMEQIRQQKTNTSRLITIVAWEEYQSSNNGEDNGEDNKKTTKRQQKDTNNNVNNVKNENNIISNVDFINSLKSNIAYKHINFDIEFAKMDAWLLTRPERKKTKRFIVNWLNKIDIPIETKKINNINEKINKQKEAIEKMKEEAVPMSEEQRNELKKMIGGIGK